MDYSLVLVDYLCHTKQNTMLYNTFYVANGCDGRFRLLDGVRLFVGRDASVCWAGCVGCLDWMCPFVGPGDQTGRPYILRNVLRTGRNGCVILSKCQMSRLRMPAVAPKYGLVTGKGIFGRFVFFMLTVFPLVFFPSVSFSFVCVPFRQKWGQVGVFVRTRRYDGADTSVRR